MCSGERPIGAAKGKQTNTMASCQPPRPLGPSLCPSCSLPDRNHKLPRRFQPTVTALSGFGSILQAPASPLLEPPLRSLPF